MESKSTNLCELDLLFVIKNPDSYKEEPLADRSVVNGHVQQNYQRRRRRAEAKKLGYRQGPMPWVERPQSSASAQTLPTPRRRTRQTPRRPRTPIPWVRRADSVSTAEEKSNQPCLVPRLVRDARSIPEKPVSLQDKELLPIDDEEMKDKSQKPMITRDRQRTPVVHDCSAASSQPDIEPLILDASTPMLVKKHRPCSTTLSWSKSAVPSVDGSVESPFAPIRGLPSFVAGKIDPFESGAVALTHSMNGRFHHFLRTVIPRVFPNRNPPLYRWLVQEALCDPALLFAMVACATTEVSARRGLIGPGVPSSTVSDVLEYKTTTIQLLNKSLVDEAKAVTTSTIYAITCMLTCHWMLGEREAIAIHVKGLQKLIAMRGGLHGFPFALIENILGTMYTSTMMTGYVPPASPEPTIQRMPLPVQNVIMSIVDPNLRETGTAILEDPRVTSLFTRRLLGTFCDRREALFYRECFQSIECTDAGLTPEIHRYLVKRHQIRFETLRTSQATTFHDAKFAESLPSSPMEEPCNPALASFWVANYFPSQAIFQRLSTDLRSALTRSGLESTDIWYHYSELLVWVLFMGTPISSSCKVVSDTEDIDGDTRKWFVYHLRKVVQERLCLEDLEGMVAILRRYFYIDRVYRRSLGSTWSDIMT